jgi:hypothetical protein
VDTLISTIRSAALCVALGIAGLSASMHAEAQTLRVTAANASNSSTYDVTFAGSGGFITPLNTDQNLHVSLRSLVFIPNTATGKIDLLVADTSRGEIVRYADAKGRSTRVWIASSGGPANPDGLSVDGEGNLFVVTSAPSNRKPAQLWVFPSDKSLPSGAGFLAPRLIDESFGGRTVKGLEESLIARASSGASGAGDLLLLASEPSLLLVYPAAGVQGVINGGGPISPVRTLLSGAQFPSGVAPGGMDFWPVDNSLLITTANGTVLRYSFTANSATRGPDFAIGLGNGKFKVKTGREAGIPLAFVANNNGGQILKFGAPSANGGGNSPLAIVTSGVQRPQGLAASNLDSTSAANCLESAGGCDVLGGVIRHSVSGLPSVTGYLIEDTCVVEIDPRIAEFGSCTGHNLPVAQVCAGYGTTVIPDYMCGASGNSGAGFALVKSTSNSLSAAKGALIENSGYAENVLIGPNNPPCPQTVLGWAPTADEGTIVEGNLMVEMTSGCGSSHSFSRGLSVWGVGLELDEGALPGTNPADARVRFAIAKYDALSNTIALASIEAAFRTTLTTCLDESRRIFDRAKYPQAAGQLLTCDALVAANESAFTGTSLNPNPSGEVRGRLANLYLQINTRIWGNTAPSTWPPAP